MYGYWGSGHIDEAYDGVFEHHCENSGIIADLGAVLRDEVGICDKRQLGPRRWSFGSKIEPDRIVPGTDSNRG